MNKWVEAVCFLRSEGFVDQSITAILEEISGIGMHKTHGVEHALFEYFDKVIISENRDLALPINVYVRPYESCAQSISKIIYSLMEEKKIININDSVLEKVFTDNPDKLKASLGDDFLKAFHIEITTNHNESNFRVIFESNATFETGTSYLLTHENDNLKTEENLFYQSQACDLMIVASLESSVGSRVKLAIDSGLPLLCEIFEETNFLDKFYYSDQLSVELKEKVKSVNFQEAV